MEGAIIVLEGIDGAGKSTLAASLKTWLEEAGYDVVLTAEPTHDRIGAIIRGGSIEGISQRTEALLFAADRSDHTEAMERWASEGKIVICDRYFASTVAYQSSDLDGTSADREWLLGISSKFAGVPKATILLDIDPSAGISRVESRGEARSRFERADFLRRVRDEYLRLAKEFNFEVIDASASSEDVLRDAKRIIREAIRCIRPKRFSGRRAGSSKERR